jgi:hypothetical protein
VVYENQIIEESIMAKDDLKVVSKTSDQEIITRELPYQLNAEELNNLGLEMANQVATQGELEESKASFMTGYKKEMDEVKGAIKLVATKIRSGLETRLIECRVEKDYLAGKVFVRRNDTGDLVEERAMSTEERQKHLFELGHGASASGRYLARRTKKPSSASEPRSGRNPSEGSEPRPGRNPKTQSDPVAQIN